MDLLLDTHALIWFLNGDKDQLSLKSKKKIEEAKAVFVSIASLWEISIKISIGKFSFDGGLKSFLKLLEENNFKILPISLDDLLILNSLEPIHTYS